MECEQESWLCWSKRGRRKRREEKRREGKGRRRGQVIVKVNHSLIHSLLTDSLRMSSKEADGQRVEEGNVMMMVVVRGKGGAAGGRAAGGKRLKKFLFSPMRAMFIRSRLTLPL